MIYLYVKTHNKTGLKYFGKTKSKDPYKYKGSGVYWKKHIKKHGYDVTTDIIGCYVDEKECSIVAEEFSANHNIVKSKEWANFKIENGLDGGFSHLNDGSITHKNRSSKAGKQCHKKHPKLAEKNFINSRTSESNKKGSITKIKKYGEDYYSKIASKKRTVVHKENIRQSLIGIKQEIIKCPHCNIFGGIRSMKRWHLDNCKSYR